MSTTAGLQLPFIPFADVGGKAGTTAPAQIARLEPKLKAGLRFGLTVTVREFEPAHCPASGVKL